MGAMEYYRETLRVEKLALGSSHKDVVHTMPRVGLAHQQRGEFDDALKYLNDALEIQKAEAEKDCVAIAQTLNHIGNVHLQRGHSKESMSALSDSVRFFRLAGKDENELSVSGFNLYGISKMHPECAPVA